MKNVCCIVLLLCCCNIFISCISMKNKNNDLEIINEKCWLSDFEVIDNKVLVKCIITIKNNTGNNIKYKINAISKEDVATGLLKNEILEGFKEDLMNNIFNISANEIIEYEKIVFIGDFAGNILKRDRNIPDKINIIILERI